MIHYSPVEFNGTIHPKSSGHSYNRFKELALRYGDLISVKYQNDVMPYVNKYDCEANRCNTNPIVPFPTKCPVCGTELVFTDKSAYCPNIKCDGRIIARTVAMLQKLNIKGFAESMMMALNIYTFRDIIKVTQEQAAPLIGEINAINFVTAIQNLLHTPTEDYKLMGALGFTGCASATWKLIFKEMTIGEFVHQMQFNPDNLRSALMSIKGIGKNTVDIIFNEWEEFCLDVDAIIKNCNIIDSGLIELKGQIRFTGCRDKQLEEELSSRGYDISGTSGVTKNTTILLVPYEGFSSTKTSKVSPDCIVVPLGEFKDNMDKYL
jgi:NAD-dependent DNA ligase